MEEKAGKSKKKSRAGKEACPRLASLPICSWRATTSRTGPGRSRVCHYCHHQQKVWLLIIAVLLMGDGS
jgi:hypothetical protein